MDESSVREIVNCIVAPILSRLEKVEKSSNDAAVWQATYGERIDNLVALVKKMADRPQKRWDAIISSIITGVVTLIISSLVFYLRSPNP